MPSILDILGQNAKSEWHLFSRCFLFADAKRLVATFGGGKTMRD